MIIAIYIDENIKKLVIGQPFFADNLRINRVRCNPQPLLILREVTLKEYLEYTNDPKDKEPLRKWNPADFRYFEVTTD